MTRLVLWVTGFNAGGGAYEQVRESQDGGEEQRAANVELLHLRRAHLEGQHATRPLPDAPEVDAQLCAAHEQQSRL